MVLKHDHETLPYIITDSKDGLATDALLRTELEALWWRTDVTQEWVKVAVEHSYCISIVDKRTSERVAFARCITDYCSFARLGDVYVLKPHQGQGLARWMINWIIRDSTMKAVPRIQLVCLEEMIPMYEKVGLTKWNDERLTLMQVDRKC